MNEEFYARLRRKRAMLQRRIDINEDKSRAAHKFMFETSLLPFLIYTLIYLSSLLGPAGLAFSLGLFTTVLFLERSRVFEKFRQHSSYLLENMRGLSFKQVLFGVLLGMATLYFNLNFTVPYYLGAMVAAQPLSLGLLQKVGVAIFCKFAIIDAPLAEEALFRGVALNWFRMKFTDARIRVNKFIDIMLYNSYEDPSVVTTRSQYATYSKGDVAQHNLVDYAEQGAAVVGSTLLFSASHIHWLQRRCTIVSGTAFAMSYIASNDDSNEGDNVETNTSAHFANNFLACAPLLKI